VNNSQLLPISVVIPTIGTRDLKPTIDSIFSGTYIPKEVLLCIPQNQPFILNKKYKKQNIRIIKCPEKGQVKQRIYGFENVNYDFVLQLDDDLILDSECIAELYKRIINLGPTCAVSPQYYDISSGNHYSNLIPKEIYLFPKLYYYLLNGRDGFVEGSISKAGLNMGIKKLQTNHFSSQWLSGGCILHYKANLILEDYLPFKGKAYAEDVIHSYKLIKSGVSLYVIKDAKALIRCFNNGNSYINSLFEYFNSVKLTYYAASLYSANYARFTICMYYYIFNIIITKVYRKFIG
jgi:glycosyltransferase involved in cell wall biosynthesis